MVIKIVKKRKYVPVRMPLQAYNNYVKRQEKMERAVRKITKKQISIPLTRIFMISSESTINLPDDYLIHKTKKRRKK